MALESRGGGVSRVAETASPRNRGNGSESILRRLSVRLFLCVVPLGLYSRTLMMFLLLLLVLLLFLLLLLILLLLLLLLLCVLLVFSSRVFSLLQASTKVPCTRS